MKTPVNRKSRIYHSYSSILKLRQIGDLMASELLALNYSRRTSKKAVSQKLIQMDCVATCIINGELWVASNSQAIKDVDLEFLRIDLPSNIRYSDIWTVKNGKKRKMHAEMQLLSELLKREISTNGLYFGVSKPCCHLCKQELDNHNIGYAMHHTTHVENWQSPHLNDNSQKNESNIEKNYSESIVENHVIEILNENSVVYHKGYIVGNHINTWQGVSNDLQKSYLIHEEPYFEGVFENNQWYFYYRATDFEVSNSAIVVNE